MDAEIAQRVLAPLGTRIEGMGADVRASLLMSIIEAVVAHMDHDGVISEVDDCLDDILNELDEEGLEPRPDVL